MSAERNVAVLVDCENAQSAVLDQAMQHASSLGRVVLRRGYGNAASLTNKWQEALIRHGFAPCLQFQYVGGKNTADIALALDALEMLLDGRANQFVIVTSAGLACMYVAKRKRLQPCDVPVTRFMRRHWSHRSSKRYMQIRSL
jgi:hypothetical protein